jgi:hypothetical protein
MVNFGFAAFLKFISLNERPQATELRRRLNPTGNGYDFHKQMKLLARRHMVGGEPMANVLSLAGAIASLPERRAAIAALGRLETWLATNQTQILAFPPATFESPRHLFRVKFEPVFGLRIGGLTAAIDIWNTKAPKLALGPTYAALSLVARAYHDQERWPGSVGVLSLREPEELHLLSDVPDQSGLANSMVERLEDAMRGTPLPPQRPEDRPAP